MLAVGPGIPPPKISRHGGDDEARVANPSRGGGAAGGPRGALGPGVPEHPAMGACKPNGHPIRARTVRGRSTMRVAVYVRVSTSRQVKLQTIEQQLGEGA